jgi:choline dehydrogenase-like flavoprotein
VPSIDVADALLDERRELTGLPRLTRRLGIPGITEPASQRRSIPMSMGKALGGGSAINVMVWARGHQTIGTTSTTSSLPTMRCDLLA